jgi:hydroxymethylglutaryl-CoA lyase
MKWVDKMIEMEINTISLADTIGVADPKIISMLFHELVPQFPNIEFGAHLHTTIETWKEKVEAAFSNGCKRFDGAIRGYGGCPMAKDELTGNMPTENLVAFFDEKKIETGINIPAFQHSIHQAELLFNAALGDSK